MGSCFDGACGREEPVRGKTNKIMTTQNESRLDDIVRQGKEEAALCDVLFGLGTSKISVLRSGSLFSYSVCETQPGKTLHEEKGQAKIIPHLFSLLVGLVLCSGSHTNKRSLDGDVSIKDE